MVRICYAQVTRSLGMGHYHPSYDVENWPSSIEPAKTSRAMADENAKIKGPTEEAASSPTAAGKSQETVPRTVHDAFFKDLFGNPENAAELLRAISPPSIAAHMDWGSLRPARASFVHEQYRQTHGDLMFEARWKEGTASELCSQPEAEQDHDDGEPDRGEPEQERSRDSDGDGVPVFLQINIEHQSTVDRWMALRGLDLTRGVWRQWREHHEGTRYLPAMLTYVFYHGASSWRAPTSLQELIAMPAAVREDMAHYMPSFRFVLDDVRSTSDDELAGREINPYPKLGIVLMKHGSARDVAEQLVRYSDALKFLLRDERGANLFKSLLRYLWNVNDVISQRKLVNTLSPYVGDELEKTMIPYAEKLRQEGREQGLEQGMVQGQRTTLLRQLESRFPGLPAAVRARVERASVEEMDRWVMRVLEADSLEAVFEPA